MEKSRTFFGLILRHPEGVKNGNLNSLNEDLHCLNVYAKIYFWVYGVYVKFM